MKKDTLATLHVYNSKDLLSNIQKIISRILNLDVFYIIFKKILIILQKRRKLKTNQMQIRTMVRNFLIL